MIQAINIFGYLKTYLRNIDFYIVCLILVETKVQILLLSQTQKKKNISFHTTRHISFYNKVFDVIMYYYYKKYKLSY